MIPQTRSAEEIIMKTRSNRRIASKRSFRPRLEILENRTLLSGITPIPEPLMPVAPLGSLIYESSPVVGVLQSQGDEATFTLPVNAGETISVDARPIFGSDFPLDASVLVTDPNGALIGLGVHPFPPARDTIVEPVRAVATGTYTITVGTANGTSGGFTLQVILNAAVDSAAYGLENSMDFSVQNIKASSFELNAAGADRLAVVGHFDGTPDFYGFSVDAGQAITVALTLANNVPVDLEL